MAIYTDEKLDALLLTERVASAFSLLGCAFVLVTFLGSPRFRKPVNRLIFYAVWGNILFNIATLISLAGPAAGVDSALCQFQSFLIQAFLPADALWNLSMAANVYLTVFRHYDAQRLRAREPWYHLINYGIPLIVALVYIFVKTEGQERVYGPATLWCWIVTPWDYLRIATCYGVAWLAMLTSFTIYVISGREIFRKRRQLREFGAGHRHASLGSLPSPTKSFSLAPPPAGGPRNARRASSRLGSLLPSHTHRTTLPTVNGPFDGIRVTSEIMTDSSRVAAMRPSTPAVSFAAPREKEGTETYSVTIEPVGTTPLSRTVIAGPHPEKQIGHAASVRARQHSAMEANTVAWGYTKCCILFFMSMLVTWVPSSVNRVYSLAHPTATPPFALSYVAGLVLPLTGFWNSLIYVVTSRAAVRALFVEDLAPRLGLRAHPPPPSPVSLTSPSVASTVAPSRTLSYVGVKGETKPGGGPYAPVSPSSPTGLLGGMSPDTSPTVGPAVRVDVRWLDEEPRSEPGSRDGASRRLSGATT